MRSTPYSPDHTSYTEECAGAEREGGEEFEGERSAVDAKTDDYAASRTGPDASLASVLESCACHLRTQAIDKFKQQLVTTWVERIHLQTRL